VRRICLRLSKYAVQFISDKVASLADYAIEKELIR
jgi:hypothetical protein